MPMSEKPQADGRSDAGHNQKFILNDAAPAPPKIKSLFTRSASRI